MAVRFTAASSQYWIRDSGTVLDHSAPYTWMTWLQLVTLPSGTDPTFLRLDRTGVGNTTEMLRVMNSTNLLRADVDGGGGSTNVSGTTALSANTWYHLAMVRTSTTNLFIYLNGVLEITNTRDVSTRQAPTRMWAGTRDAGADFVNGSLHGMKAWSAALSQDEVLAEMHSLQPKRWDNLFEYWPIFEGGSTERVTGYANAYNWTETASPTDHTSDSGIAWGGQSLFYPLQATVTPGAVTISAQLIASAETIYQATVTPGAVSISANLIASAEQVYQATVTPGAVTVTANLIASAEQVYQATVTTGAVTISAELIASAEQVYQATVSQGNPPIQANLIASGEVIYQASVTTGPVTVTANLIASAETIYQATVSQGNPPIQANLIASAEQIYQATVTTGPVTVTANLIASGETVYQASVIPGAVTVTANLIASGETVYQASVELGAVTITANLIASGEVIYLASVTTGAVTIIAHLIASGEVIYLPSVTLGDLLIVTDGRGTLTDADSRTGTLFAANARTGTLEAL